MRQLWPEQARAMDRLRDSLRVGRTRPVLQAPTGAGKTVLASAIIASARAKGNRVWFTVPAITLVDQTVRKLYEAEVEGIGVMQASHHLTDYGKPVQVVSVQTLDGLNLDALERPGLVMVDECHRQHAIIKKLIEDWPETPFIGLSATPWAKGMGRFWSNLIVASTTQELIRLGRLCPFRVFAPSHPDLSGVKVTTTGHGRDYAEGELSDAMQEGTLTADIVSTWLQRGRGRPTLVFAVDRAHALALHRQFEQAGVRSAYQDGGTPQGEREDIRKGFEAGQIELVCSVGTLTTGVDWPMISCIVLARPTKSEMLFLQIIGRGLRTHPGKEYLLILDHSDTTLRLGFVTDIHHAALDDGTPKKASEDRKEGLPRQCKNPDCTALMPKFARKCPACGFEPKPQPREVEVQEGELVELDGNKRNKTEGWPEKVAFIRGLRAYAIEKGFNSGWVAHKYRARFGVWPNDARVRDAPPAVVVELYIRSWVRSQNIRWAKSRAAANG